MNPNPLEAERVADYPRPPALVASGEHVRVEALGQLLADTHRSLRVLVSDFMFDPASVERMLSVVAREAMSLYAVQVLAADELDPPWRGAFRLVDEDQRGHLEMVVGTPEVTRYRERLHAHQAALRTGCLRRGGAFAVVNAADSARSSVMGALVPSGILELV